MLQVPHVSVPIIKDKFEPTDIGLYLKEQGLTVVDKLLEPIGLADYYWVGKEDSVTVERKQAGEAISQSGARLDSQLMKYTRNPNVGRVILIIEGVYTPSPEGYCQLWRQERDYFTKQKKAKEHGIIKKEYTTFKAYLWSLHREGIEVYETTDIRSTALTLASFVFNDTKKGEHKTLRSNLKPRPKPFKPDPYVETLMGIKDARIGEKTAIKMVDRFDTPFNALVASFEDLDEIMGEAAARRFLTAIGREL